MLVIWLFGAAEAAEVNTSLQQVCVCVCVCVACVHVYVCVCYSDCIPVHNRMQELALQHYYVKERKDLLKFYFMSLTSWLMWHSIAQLHVALVSYCEPGQ